MQLGAALEADARERGRCHAAAFDAGVVRQPAERLERERVDLGAAEAERGNDVLSSPRMARKPGTP